MSRRIAPRRWCRVLALSLLTGCNGRVKMDGIEGFGVVWSAVWMADADDDERQTVVLSNVMGVCGKMQKAALETEEFYDDIEDEYDDLDYDDEDEVCEFYESMYARYAKIYKPLYPKNAHYITMNVYEDGWERVEFDDGTWEVGDREHRLDLEVSYYGAGSLFELMADALDCKDDDDWYDAFDDAYDDFDDEYEWWELDEGGELDIISVNSEKTLKGEFGGDLLDEDGDEGGEVQGKFSASWCEIEEEDSLYFY